MSLDGDDPTFLEFASDWWAAKRRQELATRPVEWYEWALKKHLLPSLHDTHMSELDAARAVEELRDHLLAKRWPLEAALPRGSVRVRRGRRRRVPAGHCRTRAGRPGTKNHFYGDRVAMLDDPFGHRWNIATHIEEVPPDQMERRAAEAIGGA